MDPLSAIASCLAIVQILGTAISIFGTGSEALKSIYRVIDEINALKVTLESLTEQDKENIIVKRIVDECEQKLKDLRGELEKTSATSDMRKRWKWILVGDKILKDLDDIRGMRNNLILAITLSQLSLLREVHEHVKESNKALKQRSIEKSANEQEALSLIKLTLLPQILSLKGYIDGVESAGSKRPEPQSAYHPVSYTVKWLQQIRYHFMMFDLLIRTGHMRLYDKQQKKYRKASHILFDFRPLPFLEYILNTAITVNIRWGNSVGGIWIYPRFYTQVPETHNLVKAAKSGDMLLLRRLICTDSVSPFCKTAHGWTLLHFAAARGHWEVCNFLADQGVDLNATGNLGITPIQVAATFGHSEIFKYIIQLGADPGVLNDHGFSAIFELVGSDDELRLEQQLEMLEWVLVSQESFEVDVSEVDILHRDIAQLIVCLDTKDVPLAEARQSKLLSSVLKRLPNINNQNLDGMTCLHEAVKRGRSDLVDELLKMGASTLLKDARKRTALHYSAEIGNPQITQRLLSTENSIVNDLDISGDTALKLATLQNALEVAKLLLAFGASIDSSDLTASVRSDSRDMFVYLLSQGAIPNQDALEDAIWSHHEYYLKPILDAGVDINSRFKGSYDQGWTPLTLATFRGDLTKLKILLEAGADINFPSDHSCQMSFDILDETALRYGVMYGHTSVVQVMLDSGADITERNATDNLIYIAERRGLGSMVDLLEGYGVQKPSVYQRYLMNGLNTILGVKNYDPDVMEYSISKSYNINTSIGHGHRPLSVACIQKFPQVATRLIVAGADIESLTSDFDSPLFMAVAYCAFPVVELLLKKGADINHRNKFGQTPLFSIFSHYDSHRGTDHASRMVDLILQAGADVNVIDNHGGTVLGLACSCGSASIAKLLLDTGASIDTASHTVKWQDKSITADYTRRFPLDIAASEGHEKVVEVLLSRGADWWSLKQERATATSHPVLLRHWLKSDYEAPHDNAALSSKTTQCDSMMDYSHKSCGLGPTSGRKQSPYKQTMSRYLITSPKTILYTIRCIEALIFYLIVGVGTLIVVSLLMLCYRTPFALITNARGAARIIIWAIVLRIIF